MHQAYVERNRRSSDEFPSVDQQLLSAYLKQKECLGISIEKQTRSLSTSLKHQEEEEQPHHELSRTARTDPSVALQRSLAAKHAKGKKERCQECFNYQSKYNRMVSNTSATIRQQENTILELRESHRKQALVISMLQKQIANLETRLSERLEPTPVLKSNQSAGTPTRNVVNPEPHAISTNESSTREPKKSAESSEISTSSKPDHQHPVHDSDLERNYVIGEDEQKGAQQQHGTEDLLVECVECGRWVRASSHGEGIAVGYCCSSVLVSTLSDWD